MGENGNGERTVGSQTLSRGVRLLEILAEADRPLMIDELAGELGVHRSVAYRLLRTLQAHGLVERDSAGRMRLGVGLAVLAAGVSRGLQQTALPELSEIANELGMTCLLAVLSDDDKAVTLTSAVPRQSIAVVSYRPGHRHPIDRGGPGKAILMELPESAWPEGLSAQVREEIAESRVRGYAVSRNEVVPQLQSVAVPLTVPGQPPASIAVIHVALPDDERSIALRLRRAAETIARTAGS